MQRFKIVQIAGCPRCMVLGFEAIHGHIHIIIPALFEPWLTSKKKMGMIDNESRSD